MRILAGCSAEVVLIHFNHTNPLISADSAQRAEAIAAGFKVRTLEYHALQTRWHELH